MPTHKQRRMGGALGPLLLIAALASASGCGGAKGSVKQDAAGGGERLAENIRAERRGDEKVTEFDLNHDGKPDVFEYKVPGKSEEGSGPGKDVEKLVRKELDLNFDGRVDLTKYYDEKEQVVREAYDLDFDGKVDAVYYYEKGAIVRKERDLNGDGRIDEWDYLEKGKIVRKERDTNADGKVDYWEYWENDQVDRYGEDLDGDGTVDRWTKSPESNQ